jgi:methyltransferase
VSLAAAEPVLGWAVLGAYVAWRLVELWMAQRNARALLAAGGVLARKDATGFMVLVHATTLGAMAWERLEGARVGGTPSVAAAAVLLVATVGRLSVHRALGRRWTIRVITVPGERAIRTGPYRFARHPNYVVVLAEVVSLPAFLGAWWTLALGTPFHVAAILARIRCEDAAWREVPHEPRSQR